MSEPKRVEYAAAIEELARRRDALTGWLTGVLPYTSRALVRERTEKRDAFEAAIAALEEHAALVELARAVECQMAAPLSGQMRPLIESAERTEKALASDLVQRALKRDTESAPGAESEAK